MAEALAAGNATREDVEEFYGVGCDDAADIHENLWDRLMGVPAFSYQDEGVADVRAEARDEVATYRALRAAFTFSCLDE